MESKKSIERHLEDDYTEPIRDPLWRNIYLSAGLMKVIDTPVFQKLKKIRQLGPTFHVYPGATHTRFIHSLGVFHTAKMMLKNLLPHLKGRLSLTEARSFLGACLLHDIGHFPYAHSLKGIGLKEHETLTAELITETSLKTVLRDAVGADPDLTADIVDVRRPDSTKSPFLALFRNLLSGVLDPDKLDYLCRDAFYCGVPYGVQDIGFIFDRFTVLEDTYPALFASGVTAVEHLLFSKYLMYKTVYWHKTVRIATAMVKKIVFENILSGFLSQGDLYLKDDEEFLTMFKTGNLPGGNVIEDLERRKYYKVAYETPFAGESALHRKLENPERRSEAERELARLLSVESRTYPVIIDVPEPVSFEAGIPLVENGRSCSFEQSTSVFSKDFASTLSRSLRVIRVLASPESQTLGQTEKIAGYFAQ